MKLINKIKSLNEDQITTIMLVIMVITIITMVSIFNANSSTEILQLNR